MEERSRNPNAIDPWVSFDLEDQVIDALSFSLSNLHAAPDHPAAWKWVLIGIHSALHGTFCLVLRRSDGAQLLTRKAEVKTYQRWEREREIGGPIPDLESQRIDEFLNLFEKVQDSQRMNYLGGVPLQPTGTQAKNIRRLNRNRGELTHYSSTSLNYPVINFVLIMQDAIEVIDFLLNKAQPFPFTSHQLGSQANVLLDCMRREVRAIEDRLEP